MFGKAIALLYLYPRETMGQEIYIKILLEVLFLVEKKQKLEATQISTTT